MINRATPNHDISGLLRHIRTCRICVESPLKSPLPHEPNPVCVPSSTARIAICGQAPGIRVHKSGRPFTDPSGDRLREWMGVDADVFYDSERIAIIPMGFCFPGYDAKGGDLPPRPECRQKWHDQLFRLMPQIRLVLAIGQYAQSYHMAARPKRNEVTGKPFTLTETVKHWRQFSAPSSQAPCPEARVFAMPHPSWRNNAWLKRNSWFAEETLPEVRRLVKEFV